MRTRGYLKIKLATVIPLEFESLSPPLICVFLQHENPAHSYIQDACSLKTMPIQLLVTHSFYFYRNTIIKESYPEFWLSLILISRLLNAKFLNSRQIKGVSPDILTRSFVPLWLCLIPKSRLLNAKFLNSRQIKGVSPDILTRSFVPLWLCLIPKSRLLNAKILNSCKIKGLTQSQHPETRYFVPLLLYTV
jgi:hypothetical protein